MQGYASPLMLAVDKETQRRRARNLSVFLIVSLFLLIAVLSESLLARSRDQAKRAGFGCDFSLSAPHSANRSVGTTLCVDHAPLHSKLSAQFARHLAASPSAASSFSLLAVGDWGRDGYCCQRDVALEMARTASALGGIQCVINVGDSFYEYGLLSSQEEQVKTSFRDVYLGYDALRVPWLSVLGNHEYRGSPSAVLDLASQPGELFTMPARYYDRVFDVTAQGGGSGSGDFKLQMWFLDTNPMIRAYYQPGYDDGKDTMLRQPDGITSQDADKQLKWLESTLSKSTADVKLVVSHHPPFTSGAHFMEDDQFLRTKITPLLEKYGVSLMLNGHDHTMQHYAKQNVHYFITAAGSKVEAEFSHGDANLRYYGRINGFLAVQVTKHEITVSIIDIKGDIIRTTNIKV